MENEERLTEEQAALRETLIELENRDKKEDQQRHMAMLAMWTIMAVTFFLFTPVVSDERITALEEVISMFYISQAGIIASFFGSSAYMSANRDNHGR